MKLPPGEAVCRPSRSCAWSDICRRYNAELPDSGAKIMDGTYSGPVTMCQYFWDSRVKIEPKEEKPKAKPAVKGIA